MHHLPGAKIHQSHSEVHQEVAVLYCMQPMCPTMKLTKGSFPQQLSPKPHWASFTQARSASTAHSSLTHGMLRRHIQLPG